MRFTKLTVPLMLLSAVVMVTACQGTGHLKEFKYAEQANELSKGEKRLWSQSQDAVRIIQRSGKLLNDKVAEAYINDMGRKLYPEFSEKIKLEIVKAPILNAFAFPNGRLYIHTAIIAAAQNDSQLAAVVAHEIAHFTKRHSAKNRIRASNATSFAVFMNLMGIPLLGELIGLSSISGYSRDLEREADFEAIKRMKDNGYDIAEAKKLFEFMASDALANDIEAPWFFASHPDLLERIENFDKFVAKNQAEVSIDPTVDNPEVYKAVFSNVRRVAIHEKFELGYYNSLINEFENAYADSIYATNSEEWYYFANAYRMRNDASKNDKQVSLDLFEKYLKLHPDNHKAYMHAGVICMHMNDLTCARAKLDKANSLAKGESGYIKMYLKKLASKETENES